jgi:hypothetical protein
MTWAGDLAPLVAGDAGKSGLAASGSSSSLTESALASPDQCQLGNRRGTIMIESGPSPSQAVTVRSLIPMIRFPCHSLQAPSAHYHRVVGFSDSESAPCRFLIPSPSGGRSDSEPSLSFKLDSPSLPGRKGSGMLRYQYGHTHGPCAASPPPRDSLDSESYCRLKVTCNPPGRRRPPRRFAPPRPRPEPAVVSGWEWAG